MKLKLYMLLVLSCFVFKAEAQDPIFTQYFMVPETLNPGFAGFEDATYFGIIHRTQWPNLNLRVNTEYAFYNSWIQDVGGFGFSIINQNENNTNYNHLQGNASFAYHVPLRNDWYFRPAIEVGFGQKSLNFKNLLLADQINISSGTINPISSDPFGQNGNRKITFMDFAASFVFDKINTRNNTDLWFGASFKHLNSPNISFSENGVVPLDIFYSIHANYKFPYYDYFDVMLSMNYMQQGPYNRLDIGSTMQIGKLMLGAMAVTNPSKNDANSHLLTSINAFIGLEIEKLRFGFSYDINTTNIGRTDGVYELSVTYLTGCLICKNPANLKRRK